MTTTNSRSQRSFRRILVANRGEIAIRILQACRELPKPPVTYAIYTPEDATHAILGCPDRAVRIPSPSSYMDVDFMISLVKKHKIDAVHPGYGFLSESAEFSRRMRDEADCIVVGPGWEALERTGDKLMAKELAFECGVPVLKAMKSPTGRYEDVMKFASGVGYPLMVKAVDGGGGRGIRLVKSQQDLQNAVDRCVSESPSKKVFAEQAAVNDFKHIEVQIIGDGKGGARHLWERDCSVQRRFQKIVEIAPTPTRERQTIGKVIKSAMKMAKAINYLGLGTFEFLVNVKKQEFFFLEINPRLQVEHTITESICDVDIVREQLLIAQGQYEQAEVGSEDVPDPPSEFSIQLRLCAEDPNTNFALSIGKVTEPQFPSGNGVRVDTHLSKGGVVGSDFDNLMAKIIVTAPTWEQTLAKAKRALQETRISGVKTNLNLLRAILIDPGFQSGEADTQWLEQNIKSLVESGNVIDRAVQEKTATLPTIDSTSSQPVNQTTTATAFRKGDAWTLKLEPTDSNSTTNPPSHHLQIDKIARNEFPDSLIADISYTIPGSKPQAYRLSLNNTSSSAEATSSTHRRGDASNKSHIILPMSGKLVEVLVEEGDEIQENQVVAYVKQMKMELEIRSPRAGVAKWVIELEGEDGDDVAEGVLLVELEDGVVEKPDIKSRL